MDTMVSPAREAPQESDTDMAPAEEIDIPHELNRLEMRLREADAVMEPDVWDTVVRYLGFGGQPATVVELLTEEYKGYAQMASLACKWLHMLDSALPPDVPGLPPHIPANEFTLLQHLAEEKFDPEKFTIMDRQSGPPPWLDGLAASPQGRQLIYRLSSKHSTSLLLNFAIQKILMEGYVDEVARVGASLATFFGNFHRLLAARLRSAPPPPSGPPSGPQGDATSLRALSQELQDSCCAAQHTYLHAQQLLTHLGRTPGGAVFRRLSQDLEARAAASNHPGVYRMQALFVPENAPPEDVHAARLVGSMQQGGTPLRPDDVAELHHLYTRHSPPPRLTPLRQPKMLQSLVATAFTPQRGSASGVSPEVVEQCIQLLGLAAAAKELLSEDGELEGIDEVAVGAVSSSLRDALQLVATAAQASARGPTASGSEIMAAASQVLATPVAAMAVLHHVRSLLQDPTFYSEPSCRAVVPTLLNLLAQLLVSHPLLAPLVLDAAWGGARETSARNIEVSKQIMALQAHLVAHSGLSVEAVERMRGAMERKELDPAFGRYFIAQVLTLCAPPYSPLFATSMARLLYAAGVRRTHGQRDPLMGGHLREFATACTRMPPSSLQLTSREQGLLEELRS